MIPLNDLREPAVALEWHEAVAVTAGLTTTVWNLRLSEAPTLDAAFLAVDGEITVDGQGRVPGVATNGLARALGTLLESTPCPAELRQVVSRNLTAAAEADSVSEFARSLMFFERPGRQDVLRDLAARAGPALERARAAAALELLTERARQQTEPAPIPAEQAEVPAAASVNRALSPAVVGLSVFVAAALAAAMLFTTGSIPGASSRADLKPSTADDDTAPEEAPPAPAAKTSAGQAPPAPPASIAAPALTPAPHERGPREPASSTKAAAGTAAVPGPSSSPSHDVLVTVTERGGAALPGDAPPPAARMANGRIYTAADAGVSPALLVKPHLPAQPPSDVPPWEVGTIELTVGTSGAVEQVHLISPYNRYQERMLVAAAKAWMFQPAMKDGRPVRFRTRIRVTL